IMGPLHFGSRRDDVTAVKIRTDREFGSGPARVDSGIDKPLHVSRGEIAHVSNAYFGDTSFNSRDRVGSVSFDRKIGALQNLSIAFLRNSESLSFDPQI